QVCLRAAWGAAGSPLGRRARPHARPPPVSGARPFQVCDPEERYYGPVTRHSRKASGGPWGGCQGLERPRLVAMATFLLAAAGAGGLGGCADPEKEVSFEANEPAARIRAIKKAGRTEEPKAIPDLIRSLDSEDPMQRMLAIRTLE